MRSLRVKVSLFTLTLFVLGVFAGVAAWAATASFTPSPQGGNIFAVINADRSPGTRVTTISVKWGQFQRTVGRANPYGNCSGAIAGFVLMVQPRQPSSNLFTLTTNGKIVRPPYQGVAPPEVSHPCYKLERIRTTS